MMGDRLTPLKAQLVEKHSVARFQALRGIAESLRQGCTRPAGTARTSLAEAESKFFNRLGYYREQGLDVELQTLNRCW